MAKPLPSGHSDEEIRKLLSNDLRSLPETLFKYGPYYDEYIEGALQILKYINISGIDKINEINKIWIVSAGCIKIYTNIRLKHAGSLILYLRSHGTNGITVGITISIQIDFNKKCLENRYITQNCLEYHYMMQDHFGDKWRVAQNNKPICTYCVLTEQDLLEQNIDNIILDIILRTKDAVDEINGIEE